MGGYAAYVWPSYGFTAVVLIGMLAIVLRTTRKREAEVERLRALGADPRRGFDAGRASDAGVKPSEVVQ